LHTLIANAYKLKMQRSQIKKYATHTQILNICIESGFTIPMQKYFVANLATPFLQRSAIVASSVFLKENIASRNFVKVFHILQNR
jgi:hypothetical protein